MVSRMLLSHIKMLRAKVDKWLVKNRWHTRWICKGADGKWFLFKTYGDTYVSFAKWEKV